MINLAIVTTTRADYGLYKPIIQELSYHEKEINFSLIVTGMHLGKEFGNTIEEIEKDNIKIAKIIKIPLDNEKPSDISNNISVALNSFTKYFEVEKFDYVMVLGDRYEMFAIAIAATLCKIPLIHLYGGDTTEGMIDECIRHSITKMSYYHFVTNDKSKKRVIQLGESPARVFCVGATGIDNILNMPLYSKKDFTDFFDISNDSKIGLGTYHPVTLENQSIEENISDFIKALADFPEIQFIITKANSDLGGSEVNKYLEKFAMPYTHIHIYSSLGIQRYLSVMKNALFVIGNSSSGIYETPSFKIPTINIGSRQLGRLQAKSVINCSESYSSIKEAIEKSLSLEFREFCQTIESPYGNGNAAKKIVKKLISLDDGPVNLSKSFFDLEKVEL